MAITNLPANFPGKCKDFEQLDVIALHFFRQKKLKTFIQSEFDTYTASPIYD
ncbi:hypothetical protein [Roseofilum sp. Guam]|uniref:hypothetical protein n=1 Tax=Roseofilum sp. Guam TaxID=2821502 RepID=UPI001B2E9897|nr:hypothetical protein [Roseofilum sp. Guam]MBP0027031.1 hypothetical protein [Roseofilum sp. Guam]